MKDVFIAQLSFLPTELSQFLNNSPFLMANWKWFLILALSAAALTGRPLLQQGLRSLKKISPWWNPEKKTGFWCYWIELPTERSFSWILLCLVWFFAIDNMALPLNLEKYLTLLTQIILAVNILRLLYVSADALGQHLAAMAAKTQSKLDDVLAPFATKAAKILIVVLGSLIALQNFGLNVMGLLAGLGLGGLALALAAQDTAANLFGSITILTDRPFTVGDWVKMGGVEGTVEEIGFRSTRLRTAYNSVVAIPNSVASKENIDNMGTRRRRRVRQVLGLHYDTPPAKIEEFCEAVRYAILQEPKVDREGVLVSFHNFGASTLDVLVLFHVLDSDFAEELSITQNVLLDVIHMAGRVGVVFAYPTQTVYHLPATPSPGVAMLGSSYQDPPHR